MSLEGKTIGVALTGSFCTYEKAFEGLQNLVDEGALVQTIFQTLPAPLTAALAVRKIF